MVLQAKAMSDEQAVVLGTNLILGPDISVSLSNMGFLSPDGQSYSFDHRANGYARGEGVVALVLKPLDAAIAAGDVVRAVVRATGSNQDGRSQGFTQPRALTQEELIRHVYAKAGLGFGDTRYFEAHGQ
jgi:acyl transferase domain-containing protein